MTLDGKIATRTGSSQWISNPQSREIVHRLRGRVDAIIVGRETARRDDPLLTARPAGPRTALRIVTDTRGTLSSQSQLVRTAGKVPLLVAVGHDVPQRESKRLQLSGCEVLVCEGETHAVRLAALLDELGRRRLTNVMVEGGSRILGTLLDSGEIDEVHTFIAPRLVGGVATAGPTAGEGVAQMSEAVLLESPEVRQIGCDIYVHGRVARKSG
jgi:diaminohydroxyphosphoribosylaminopyrimidine deaminase/5-amino-6-(5-phosphoribosylamino)uracil reductase